MKTMAAKAATAQDTEKYEAFVDQMRARARAIIEEFFPGYAPTRFEIERVVSEIIHTGKGFVFIEKNIEEEKAFLKDSIERAKRWWPHDGHTLSAALDAYDERYGQEDDDNE